MKEAGRIKFAGAIGLSTGSKLHYFQGCINYASGNSQSHLRNLGHVPVVYEQVKQAVKPE